ncbi:LPS-assembly protein LptD [Peteryoungia desertarenae]|uniref:LPS-assembly protein LptD n=1 Tax=Peteryoungia desertarenae TaxID=1813451 RepID=A0ABX6QNC0_9HYPH|nr:LPS-assembly protein LptD [Peteryoungia desertarenae]QLF70004.1 LPS-assembly protein LptD [Peteryoungia desertarenae]
MAASDRENIRRLVGALLTGVAVCALLATAPEARAQESNSLTSPLPQTTEDQKLLLSANELVYDRDQDRVVATGAVQINYAGYQMVARRVEYDQASGRVIASGNIELIEPTGNRIYADSLDVTDNFSDGFVSALRVETTDNTRLAAESAERVAGNQMILNRGVYTACLPCAENPQRPPLWQVKAERVIQDGQKKTIRLEKARFELFGHTLAVLPFVEVPDHTVKRKTGFLFPSFKTTENLGFGISVPYYIAISNTRDATITATGYTSQGVLLEAEIRQRFETGDANLRFAGINQMNSDRFSANTSDSNRDFRGMVATKGDFKINPRWAFGWDLMLQTDNNFAKTYEIEGHSASTNTNQVYLTGIGERNFFDIRGYYFDVQDADLNDTAEKKQATVMPVLDYSYYAPEPIFGGQLSGTLNFTSLSRFSTDFVGIDTNRDGVNDLTRYYGVKGNVNRLTGELEWERSFIAPGGLELTPILAARGDAFGLAIDDGPVGYSGNFTTENGETRYMMTAGLEARYPWLITTNNSSHIIEPIGQIFVRNNEQLAGSLPNEDAQSFVFDATNLFQRDKFSGFDRVEGGTRANLGVRYTGTFDNGFGVRALLGQSYHIGGVNSFATSDLLNIGVNSGLETDVSDFVAMAGLDTPMGLSLSTSVRLDEKSLELRRTDVSASVSRDRYQASVTFTQLEAQPQYGFTNDNQSVSTSSSLKVSEYWSVFGGVNYDIDANKFSSRAIGISYADECTVLSISYSDTYDPANKTANDWTVMGRLTFRTLGDIQLGTQ